MIRRRCSRSREEYQRRIGADLFVVVGRTDRVLAQRGPRAAGRRRRSPRSSTACRRAATARRSGRIAAASCMRSPFRSSRADAARHALVGFSLDQDAARAIQGGRPTATSRSSLGRASSPRRSTPSARRSLAGAAGPAGHLHAAGSAARSTSGACSRSARAARPTSRSRSCCGRAPSTCSSCRRCAGRSRSPASRAVLVATLSATASRARSRGRCGP